MRWLVLGGVLFLILVAALVFALLSPEPAVTSAAPDPIVAPVRPSPPSPAPREAAPLPPPAPRANAVMPAPPPTTPPAANTAGLIAEPVDPDYLAAIGIDPSKAEEPEDAGRMFKVDKDGIRSAVKEKIPEIKECYESWLQSNPNLQGKIKLGFTISEMPGKNRAIVSDIDVLDGGMGHVAMEGCVKNVFSTLRFEVPEHGETKVTYPLNFSTSADAG